jgi:hypothetical protein
VLEELVRQAFDRELDAPLERLAARDGIPTLATRLLEPA